MDEEVYEKNRWTYQWREFGGGCEREPNDALSDRNHIR
jgi:hypothetical protein